VAALQRLARALALRLTQDVDSVLRDVRLWLTPPTAARAMSPSPSTSSATPLQLSGSESDASGAGSIAAYHAPVLHPAPQPQQPDDSAMRTLGSDSGSSDTEVRMLSLPHAHCTEKQSSVHVLYDRMRYITVPNPHRCACATTDPRVHIVCRTAGTTRHRRRRAAASAAVPAR